MVMVERVVSDENEVEPLVLEMKGLGLRPAAISNAGLPRGQCRITFLPEEVFTTPEHPNE